MGWSPLSPASLVMSPWVSWHLLCQLSPFGPVLCCTQVAFESPHWSQCVGALSMGTRGRGDSASTCAFGLVQAPVHSSVQLRSPPLTWRGTSHASGLSCCCPELSLHFKSVQRFSAALPRALAGGTSWPAPPAGVTPSLGQWCFYSSFSLLAEYQSAEGRVPVEHCRQCIVSVFASAVGPISLGFCLFDL